jgi:hypothetical protein
MMCPLGQLSVHIVGLELIRADCGPRRRRRRKKKRKREKDEFNWAFMGRRYRPKTDRRPTAKINNSIERLSVGAIYAHAPVAKIRQRHKL